MKKDLEKLGFTITSEEIKPYGTYYKGFMNYNDDYGDRKRKLEVNVSKVKGSDIYVNISENHFRGNVKGYVTDIEELAPIIRFMTRGRNA